MSFLFKDNGKGLDLYNKVKAHYEDVKPIRGKRASENIRPMGNRVRTWERVVEDVRVVSGKDETWYGYRLYDTDVVMVSPTGIIEFKTDAWNTPSTAQFIDYVGRRYMDGVFGGRKYKNKIWVIGMESYPITGKTAFNVGGAWNEHYEGMNTVKPIETIVERIPVIDRKKMKVAMTPYMPMVNYLNAMLKLTGGLLSFDLRNSMKERVGDNSWRYSFIYKFSNGKEMEEMYYYRDTFGENDITKVLDIAENGTEEDWLKLLFVIYKGFSFKHTSVGFHEIEVKYSSGSHKNKIDHVDIYMLNTPTAIREKVAGWVKKVNDDVWKDKLVNHGL
jgi:hypothetical protein